jgi:hypothetical protein
VTSLEREVSVLKDASPPTRRRANIPGFIKMEFPLANSQMARFAT